jgi:hypothetical protein
MIAKAIGNGTRRSTWLLPRSGSALARQISTVSLLNLLAIYIAAVFRRRRGYFVSRLMWRQMLAAMAPCVFFTLQAPP